MKSGCAISHEMKRKPVMNCSGVCGMAAWVRRIRSHGFSRWLRTAMPMWVLLVKSTARRPTRSSTGAICRICRVGNLVAPHRLWLPSRIDTSTSSTVATMDTLRPHHDEDGILVGGLRVVDEELDH